MATCKVDRSKSTDFTSLCDYWRRHGFPSVDKDVSGALAEISKNHEANHCRRMQRFENLLGGRLLLKYRFKDSARREGARGGWRMIAILDTTTRILYPIMIYPKKVWEMPGDEELSKCVSNLSTILRQPDLNVLE